MKIDLSLNSVDAAIRALVDSARCAESTGFDGLWTYDHVSGAVLGGRATLDVWIVLAAIAQSTERVSVGPLVLNATARHPAHINVAAASLQELSQGRLLLGLGAGAGPESPYSRELSMFGLHAENAVSRRRRVVETIGVLRSIWDGRTHYTGEQLHTNGVEAVAMPNPRPAIIVGANGPRMAELAGRHADGVNLHSWESNLAGLIEVARSSAADADNESLDVSVECPLTDEWLDPDGERRGELVDAGVTRLQFVWSVADGAQAIESAAKTLRL